MVGKMNNNSSPDCLAHAGIVVEIKNMKADISSLWAKWGFAEKLLIGILFTVVGNLLSLLVIIYFQANGG